MGNDWTPEHLAALARLRAERRAAVEWGAELAAQGTPRAQRLDGSERRVVWRAQLLEQDELK